MVYSVNLQFPPYVTDASRAIGRVLAVPIATNECATFEKTHAAQLHPHGHCDVCERIYAEIQRRRIEGMKKKTGKSKKRIAQTVFMLPDNLHRSVRT